MPEERLNPADDLATIAFGNRALYSTVLCHGNQRGGEVGRTEEDGESRSESADGVRRMQSIQHGHAKIQDEKVRDSSLNLPDYIPAVERFRTDPPRMFFNELVQLTSHRRTVIGD